MNRDSLTRRFLEDPVAEPAELLPTKESDRGARAVFRFEDCGGSAPGLISPGIFGDTLPLVKIVEIMKPVSALRADASVIEAAHVMKTANVGVLPVGNEDEIKGVVTHEDIAVSAVAEDCNPHEMRVDEITSHLTGFCHEEQEADAVLKTMREYGQTSLLVRNSEGRLVGVVSVTDIMTDAENGSGSEPDHVG